MTLRQAWQDLDGDPGGWDGGKVMERVTVLASSREQIVYVDVTMKRA